MARFRYDLINALKLAFDSIRVHKLRSFLTLLGVIIGVASVIMVGSAIEGLGLYAEQSTAKAFGSDSYLIAQIASAGRLSRKEYFDKVRRNKQLTLADDRYLESINSDNTLYSPYQQHSADIKREGFICEESSVLGVSASLVDIRDITLTEGRFFTEEEERTRTAVAVIGDETRAILFPDGGSPLGKEIKINGIDFVVVGVQEKLGSAFGRSQDKSAYIPITVYNRMYGQGQSIAIFGRPKPGTGLSLQQSLDLTRVALRTKFHNRPGQTDTFDTLTPDAIRGFIDTLLALVTAVVIPVTCISLLVGGIVIMNIMLVSVTERTREIGIRKALGARRFDIMLQILIESVLMACMGGALGVALGAVVTQIVGRVFDISMRITWPYILVSLAVSTIVGVASGWYPASRAAKLDPIEALRSE
ncbi:MAG: ABC transporter permease [Bryobacteraceae bacterium]